MKRSGKQGLKRSYFSKPLIGLAIVLAVISISLINAPYVYSADKPPIKIAHLGVITGLMSSYGGGGLNGLKVFVKQVNEDGGILGREVVLLSRDTGGRPENAVKEMKRAVLEDKVNFIITTDTSGVILAECPVAAELKCLLIHNTASTIKFQNKVCNRYSFRTGETSKFFIYSLAKRVSIYDPQVLRWAAICPDYEWGHVAWEGFQKYAKELNPNVEIVGNIYTPFGSADFRPYISKILALKPQGVMTALWSGELVTFIKQAKMYGFFDKIKRFVDLSSTTMDVSMAMGEEMVETYGNSYYYFGFPDTPQHRRFIDDYREMFGDYPVSSAGSGFRAGHFLKAAIEKANTIDTEKVIDAFDYLTVATPAGGQGWMRPHDHQVQSEYMVTGRTAPDPNYPFWTFKDIWLCPGTEGNATKEEVEGCL